MNIVRGLMLTVAERRRIGTGLWAIAADSNMRIVGSCILKCKDVPVLARDDDQASSDNVVTVAEDLLAIVQRPGAATGDSPKEGEPTMVAGYQLSPTGAKLSWTTPADNWLNIMGIKFKSNGSVTARCSRDCWYSRERRMIPPHWDRPPRHTLKR